MTLAQARTGALLVASDIYFGSRSDQIIALTARHAWSQGLGSPNKLTVNRVEEVVRSGKRPPAENLRVIADRVMAMAAHYQPELTDPRSVSPRATSTLEWWIA